MESRETVPQPSPPTTTIVYSRVVIIVTLMAFVRQKFGIARQWSAEFGWRRRHGVHDCPFAGQSISRLQCWSRDQQRGNHFIELLLLLLLVLLLLLLLLLLYCYCCYCCCYGLNICFQIIFLSLLRWLHTHTLIHARTECKSNAVQANKSMNQ